MRDLKRTIAAFSLPLVFALFAVPAVADAAWNYSGSGATVTLTSVSNFGTQNGQPIVLLRGTFDAAAFTPNGATGGMVCIIPFLDSCSGGMMANIFMTMGNGGQAVPTWDVFFGNNNLSTPTNRTPYWCQRATSGSFAYAVGGIPYNDFFTKQIGFSIFRGTEYGGTPTWNWYNAQAYSFISTYTVSGLTFPNPYYPTAPKAMYAQNYRFGSACLGPLSLGSPTSGGTNNPPSATIIMPTNGASFTSGTSVAFSGNGTDPDAGDSILGYEWGDGSCAPASPLSTASFFTSSALSIGSHTLYLRVKDSHDAWSPCASVTISITAPPVVGPPTAIISYPSANQTVAAGTSVSFVGNGTADQTAGFNYITNYEWREGSCSGTLLGSSLSYSSSSFSVGSHQIFLRVKDLRGSWSTNCPSRTITVTTPPTAGPPTAFISYPSANQTVAAGTNVFLIGSGTADQTGGYNFITNYEWRDGSCASGALLSTSSSYSNSRFSVGAHQIFLRVKDLRGVWSTNCPSRTVTVTAPPPPAVTFSVSPTTVATGGTIARSWNNITNATSCTASGDWSGAKSIYGGYESQVLSIAKTYTYTLSCTGAGGAVSVTRTASAVAPTPPSATITAPAADQSVIQGASVFFSGSGTADKSLNAYNYIANYEWREGSCTTGTLLASSAGFTKNNFSLGAHTVYLRVKDFAGLWSTNCPSRTITVNPPASCTPTTISNCALPTTASGSSAGSCATGYAGTCSYSCNNGTWSRNANNCALAVCTGTVPANASVYSGDTTGLSANTPYTYASPNTGAKCQFSCNAGYTWNGTSCTPASCTLPWGGTIASGASVTAYQSASVAAPASCNSQTRTCTNGSLSGSYANQSCTVTNPDLTAGATTAVPTSGTTGQNVTFSGTVSNIGTGSATNFYNLIQIADSAITTTIALLETGRIGTFPAGASTPVSASYSGFSVAGSYNVRTCANFRATPPWGGSISESNTGNNCGAWLPFIVAWASCGNGANNPPSCTQCPNGQAYLGGSCQACTGGCTGSPGGSAGNPFGGISCVNGAVNPINCNAYQPSANLTATPTTIDAGQSTRLTWSSTNATSCYPSGGEGVGFSTGGQPNNATGVMTGSLTQTTPFGLTCTGPGGSAADNEVVTVVQPDARISASPTRVSSGDPSSISWSATGVASCTVSGPGLSVVGAADASHDFTAGSPRSIPITSQSTFTITCTTVGGSSETASVTVNISQTFQEF